MNPAAFPCFQGIRAAADPTPADNLMGENQTNEEVLYNFQSLNELRHAHGKRVARTSLGETTTPYTHSLVVDLCVTCCD